MDIGSLATTLMQHVGENKEFYFPASLAAGYLAIAISRIKKDSSSEKLQQYSLQDTLRVQERYQELQK